MKKLLIVLAVAGFSFAAQADHGKEIQISSNYGTGAGGGVAGTNGGITINDEDTGLDNSPWGLSGEVYFPMSNHQLQVGALLAFGDADSANSELNYTLGAMIRYNLDEELRDSMFFGLGLAYSDLGVDGTDSTRISALISVGKRYALSDNVTWTPNVSINTAVGGDTGFDEGMSININLLSFSGFM